MLIRMLSQTACVMAMTFVASTLALAAPPLVIEPANYNQAGEPAPVPPPGAEGVAQVPAIPQQPCVGGQCAPMPGSMCRSGYCQNGYCQNGSCPTMQYQSYYSPTADCYAGKPYTFGDLACDWRAAKSSCDECSYCDHCSCKAKLHDWWCNEKYKMHCRKAYRNQVLGAHLHNKFNYFVPSGNGGEGVPIAGIYKRVYATNPGYYDARDKQVYAAGATGVPMAVPLAPGVRYQYNYGWGVPSSRITEISTIAPPRY